MHDGTLVPGRWHRLVPRGDAGLSCGETGVALGPMPLISRAGSANGKTRYVSRPAVEIARTFGLAYRDMSEAQFGRCLAGLGRITEAFNRGDRVRAAIIAVQLRLLAIDAGGMTKLAAAWDLHKYDPDEPRVPASNPDGGQWTSAGGNERAGPQHIENTGIQSDASSTTPTAARAHSDNHRNTVIEYGDGSREIRSGGSRQWRNNNPGAMWYGPFTRSKGAIGQDGPFAIFPDADTGYRAIVSRLSSAQWRNFTLGHALIHDWAPKNENDSASYAVFVSQKSGVPLNARLGDLTREKIDSVAKAIKLKEGWSPGNVTRQPAQ